MVSGDNASKVYNMVKGLSEIETHEIEFMLAIFKKTVDEEVEKKVDFLTNEFQSACSQFKKKEENMLSIKDDILGAYQKNFYRIKERVEEQYVNLIFELQEAQSLQKLALANYFEISNKDFISSEESETLEMLIDKYGNYCGLEDECYKLLDECFISAPYLINTVMKFEETGIVVERPKGFINKIKAFFKSLFSPNSFEKVYLDVKRKRIEQITDNTDEVIEEIRTNTVNYIDTLELYKKQIKEASNANIIM